MRWAVLVLLLVSGAACEKAFFPEEPANTYEQNFEVFWTEFDRNYSFFEVKKIDWDSVHAVYLPEVLDVDSDDDFFYLLAEIANSLKDGHVNVMSPYGRSRYDFAFGAPENSTGQVKHYVADVKLVGNTLEYAMLKDYNIGYVLIKSFGNEREDYRAIEEVLRGFKDTDGLIVDVRHNGGGSTNNSQEVATRFADEERLYLKIKYKNGPGHGDFTPWTERTVKPDGDVHYLKPVAVLTNRRTFSAAEDFVLAMRLFPHVAIVGDTTGGGSGNPITRELPNGWLFRLSSWIAAGPDEVPFEGIGLYPDVPVWNSPEDTIAGTDRILERAILEVLLGSR